METNSTSSVALDDAALLAEMGWLRRLAARLVQDPSLAEDLAQQAWLAAKADQRAWHSRTDLRAWLAKVVQNLARSAVRRDRRRKEVEGLAHDGPRHAPAADEMVARAQMQAELAKAVLELEEPHRSAILLRFLDELDYKQVGARLGIGADAARKRVERALAELRARLDARHKQERGQWLAALVAFADGPPPQPWPLAPLRPAAATAALVGAAAVVFAVATLAPWTVGPAPAPVAKTGTPADRQVAELGVPDAQGGAGGSSLASGTQAGLRILEESGAPAVGYSVLRHADGRFDELLQTGPDGGVSWPDAAPGAAMLVWRDDYALQRVDLPDAGAEQMAVLPEGAAVAGTLAGVAADAPCLVYLTHDRPAERIIALGATRFASPYASMLEDAPPTARVQRLKLAPDGTFRLRGLPPAWSGAIELRSPYVYEGAPSHGSIGSDAQVQILGGATDLQLREPTTGLVASVAMLPCARGRLVEGAQLRPVERGSLQLSWRRGSAQMPLPIAADGSFRLPLLPTMERDGDATVELRLAGRGWTRSVLVRDIEPGGDLGVFVVPEADLRRIVVLDHAGAPLAGALVVVQEQDGEPQVWNQSDRAGTAEFLVPRAATRLVRVVHEGHRPQYARIGQQGAVADPVPVRLERAAGLLVRVVDASGRDLPGALRVSAPLAPAPQRDWRELGGLDAEALAAETGWLALQERGMGVAAVLATGRDTRIDNVVRGIPLLVEWLATDGTVQAAATTMVPQAEWSRRVEIVWGANGFRLHGSVRDSSGAAIAGAILALGRDHEDFDALAVSGADGRFEFATRRAPLSGMSVSASKSGFATASTPPRDFGPDDTALDLVLEPSRPLAVMVVDAQHRPVERCTARARFAAPHGTLRLVPAPQPGKHVASDAPRLAGSVDVVLAGSAWSFPLPALDDPATIVLDGAGAVRISIGAATAAALRGQEVEVLAHGAGAEQQIAIAIELRPDGTAAPAQAHLPAGEWSLVLRARSGPAGLWIAHGLPLGATILPGSEIALGFP